MRQPPGVRVLKRGDPERLVCDGCGFVFYLGPKLVAGAIFEMDGGIVLVQRDIEPGYGKWTFPGGFVERGERAEAAAEREALEETGVEIEVTGIVGLYTYDGQIPAIAVFVASAVGGDPDAAGRNTRREELPTRRRPPVDGDGLPEHRAGPERLPAKGLAKELMRWRRTRRGIISFSSRGSLRRPPLSLFRRRDVRRRVARPLTP